MKCTRIGEKRCNCSCFEIDQEMDAILLIIGIAYSMYPWLPNNNKNNPWIRLHMSIYTNGILFHNKRSFGTTSML
jgi:hypothetical protein